MPQRPRPRRNRKNEAMRSMVRENVVRPANFIYPLFIHEEVRQFLVSVHESINLFLYASVCHSRLPPKLRNLTPNTSIRHSYVTLTHFEAIFLAVVPVQGRMGQGVLSGTIQSIYQPDYSTCATRSRAISRATSVLYAAACWDDCCSVVG